MHCLFYTYKHKDEHERDSIEAVSYLKLKDCLEVLIILNVDESACTSLFKYKQTICFERLIYLFIDIITYRNRDTDPNL